MENKDIKTKSLIEFLSTAGLYLEREISLDEYEELEQILDDRIRYTFKMYCPQCKERNTFYFCDRDTFLGTNSLLNLTPTFVNPYEDNTLYKYNEFIKEKYLRFLFAFCAQDITHNLIIPISIKNGTITKIGQFPKVTEFLYPQINEYKKLLNEYFIELQTALQLNSNGVGIGAFVYLRRIFEKIIFNKFEELDNKSLTVEIFQKLRFEDKIKKLKDVLPQFMVENKEIYSILSKGIHELDEEECLKYFDALFNSIKWILDEIIEQKEKEKKKKALESDINKINSTLKNK